MIEYLQNYCSPLTTLMGNGYLQTKALEYSFEMLMEHLPLEVASRNGAYGNVYFDRNCSYYMESAQNATKAAQTCEQFDFTNVTQLKLFVNGSWYGDLYKTKIMEATNFTEEEYTAFYATGNESNPQSFGNFMQTVTLNTATHFNCINTTNCSGYDLAMTQWSTSMITRSPGMGAPDFTFKCNDDAVKSILPCTDTVADWGDYEVPGLYQRPPEFYYYQVAPNYLNDTDGVILKSTSQIKRIFDPQGAWYGVGNIYNAI